MFYNFVFLDKIIVMARHSGPKGDPKKKKSTGDKTKAHGGGTSSYTRKTVKAKPSGKPAVKKKTATPKAGTNVASKMTAKQKASFKKKRGIDFTVNTAGGGSSTGTRRKKKK